MQSFKGLLANEDLREASAELTRTDLRQELLPAGVSSCRLDALILCFGGVLQAAASLPIELSKSSCSVPKFLILQAQGLHTRYENGSLSSTTSIPTARQVSARISPRVSFRFDGLKDFLTRYSQVYQVKMLFRI